MLDATTVLKKSDQQVSCNLNNEVAILDLKSSLYFGLDVVGAHIWQELDNARSVEVLCRSVQEHFEVEPATCRADVVKFLTSLVEAGLIEAK
jgi:hypothetical protein